MKKVYVVISQALLISLLMFSLFGAMILLPIMKNLSDANLQNTTTYDWTYMVYCDADNNLDSYGVADVNEMEVGYSNSASSHVKVIVFMDRETSGAKTYDIIHDTGSSINSPILTTGFPSEPNMGSKTTLKNFITYCFNNYPAAHYVLDLWDHGGGIFGICWDDSNGNDKLTFDEVDEAITETCTAAAERIDILAMDACLMAMLEGCYEWREYVDYFVASEETIPGDGYPYNTMIASLCSGYGAFNSNPGAYASDMVNKYHSSYSSGDDTTLSSIKLKSGSINNLTLAFNEFTQALLLQIGPQKSSITAARAATQEFYYEFFIDLWDLAFELKNRIPAIQNQCDRLMNNITSAVTLSLQHNNPGAYGISIYFPATEGDYDTGYASAIDLGQETQWAIFLQTFYQGVTYGLTLTGYQYDDASSINGSNIVNGIPQQGETVNVSVSIKNTGTIPATLVNGTLSCSNSNITLIIDFQQYGTLTAGSSKPMDFQLNISQLAPTGLVIAITCVIRATFETTPTPTPYEITRTLNLIINLSAITGGADFESAQTIPLGISHGVLPGPDPTDSSAWFKILVTAGKYLICSIINADPGTDFDIYIYSPAGSIMTAAVKDSYPDTCSTYIPTPGEYRIRVVPYQGTGTYTINVTISDTPGPEDGLSFGTAFTINQNDTKPLTGSVPTESKSGYMFYRVLLTRGQAIEVILNADDPSTDFDLVLASNVFESLAQSAGTSYPERIKYSATYDGYYYIVVIPYSGSGSFDLTVNFTDAFVLETWVIILIIVIVVIAVIVGLILFFKMT